MLKIQSDLCVKCGTCSKVCVIGIFSFSLGEVPTIQSQAHCIQCWHCIAACPTQAIVDDSFSDGERELPPLGCLPDSKEMMNLLRQRRSIRHYADRNISNEEMEQLKSSLTWMPSGCNDRRLFFAIVEDKKAMCYFKENVQGKLSFLFRSGIVPLLFPKYRHFIDIVKKHEDVIFRGAPHMIVCASHKKAPCKDADPWIALSYFDLLAQSMGIATCWCGFAVIAFKLSPAMRKRINLPVGYRVHSVLLFGYPDEKYVRPAPRIPYPIQSVIN